LSVDERDFTNQLHVPFVQLGGQLNELLQPKSGSKSW